MKKLFYTIGFFLGFSALFAQAIYVQDFEDGFGEMTLVNQDGRTPHPNVSGFTDAWILQNFNGSVAAMSTSWYQPAGAADDWMITPKISVPASGAVTLRWKGVALDPQFPDGYEVKVSTTDDALSSFTDDVFTIAAEGANAEDSYTDHQVDLSAYAGMDIYIAFRNNSNDQFILALDDIYLGVLIDNDGALDKLGFEGLRSGRTLEGSKMFQFTLTNFGKNIINEAKVNLNFDGEDFEQSYSDLNLAPGESVQLTFERAFDLIITGQQSTTTLQILEINGETDQSDFQNTTSVSYEVVYPVPNFTLTDTKGEQHDLHEVLRNGQSVVLDFFASWCQPCELSTPQLNSYYEQYNSGDSTLNVFGLTIEPADDDNVVNNLGWGATYPKFSWNDINGTLYSHYSTTMGLGSGAIPFFVQICPNSNDPGRSTISHSAVGFQSGMFNEFRTRHEDCQANLPTSVQEINTLNELSINPSPATDFINISFDLERNEKLQIDLTNSLGQLVQVIRAGNFSAGTNRLQFNVQNIPNGLYFVRFRKENQVNAQRVMIHH